jgi:hypothetical protein
MRHVGLAPPAALALCALAISCGGAQPAVKSDEPRLNRWGKPIPKEGTKAPAWVDRAPEQTRTRFYAVGVSGPTFWPQDALANAQEDARGRLALSLSSHLEVLGRSAESAGSKGGSQKQLDLTKEATDLVVQNSRIEATWIDEAGARGEAGSTWALAVLDTGASRASGDIEANGAKKKGNAMPGWLDRLPAGSGRIYAAGYSGPTFQPEAALDYAGEAALDNLCAALRSHVQAYTLIVETGTGLSVDEFSRAEDPDAAFKELVKKSARVEAVWVDEQGARPGDPPGSVWALAGIDVGSTRGGFDVVRNADTGPALDAHGNIAPGTNDAKARPTLQAEAQAEAAQKALQDKAAQTKQQLDTHNASVKQGVQAEQAQVREETRQQPPPAAASATAK